MRTSGVFPFKESGENGVPYRTGGSPMRRRRAPQRICSQNLLRANLRRFMLRLKQNPRLVFAYAISAFLLALFLLMIATAYVFLKIDKMPYKSVVGSNSMRGAPDRRIVNIASDFGHLFDTTPKRSLIEIIFSESVVSSKHVAFPRPSTSEQRIIWAEAPDYGELYIDFFEYDTERAIYHDFTVDNTEWRDPEAELKDSSSHDE
jgi:hypothetical protein